MLELANKKSLYRCQIKMLKMMQENAKKSAARVRFLGVVPCFLNYLYLLFIPIKGVWCD